MHGTGAWIGVAAVMAGVAGCAEEARFRHSADVRAAHVPATGVEARTENGSITVVRAAVAAVEVHADVKAVTQERADATVVKAERGADGTLMVTVAWPGGRRESNEGCSLEIKVPEAVGVRLFTSNGSIDARGLGGASTMETSNGSVVVMDHAGSVGARSSNGKVVLTRIGGAATAATSNGDVEVQSAAGAVKVDTSNGSVKVMLGAGEAGPVDVETSNGSVRLEVGAGFAGAVEVETSNGSVDVTGTGPVQVAGRGKDHAMLTFGVGGAKSRLTTSNGSVVVTGGK